MGVYVKVTVTGDPNDVQISNVRDDGAILKDGSVFVSVDGTGPTTVSIKDISTAIEATKEVTGVYPSDTNW